jgi:hypothetical protein
MIRFLNSSLHFFNLIIGHIQEKYLQKAKISQKRLFFKEKQQKLLQQAKI